MHGQGNLELFLVFLIAAVVAVPLFRRFGLGAVRAYLVAGVVLGPYELRAVRDPEPVLAAAEIGAMEFLLDKMKTTKSNDEFFASMKR